MDYVKLSEMLFPQIDKKPEYYFKKYPQRNLNSRVVSRYAPSPTGYMHIGNFFQMFIAYNLTRVTDGVMFLRIEDTDSKREKQDAVKVIYEILSKFGINFNEYQTLDGKDIGNYGPYVQSKRIEIYQCFAKYLVSIGKAFPCFCKKTEGKEDILKMRETKWKDDDEKEYDSCRDLSFEAIETKIKAGENFAIRLRTENDGTQRIKFHDLIKGEIDAKANAKDFIILKNDGVPPYAFAHAVDDTLMGTTIVVRGEEYISSTPAHLELFNALGFKPIQYCHNPLICKIDENTGNRRKISKRLDAEADMRYYFQKGYPIESVLEYLLNIINSGFEQWRKDNPDLSWDNFKFGVNDITASSPIFDLVKLDDISKNIISKYSAEQFYDQCLKWATEYDTDFATTLINKREFAIKVFNIDRGGEKPRKDISKFSEVKDYYNYMFNDNFKVNINTICDNLSDENICMIMNKYANIFTKDVDKNEWFEKVKGIGLEFNFCCDNKEYKQNPDKYCGNTAKLCAIIRRCLTGMDNTPDLYSISSVLGYDQLVKRVNKK